MLYQKKIQTVKIFTEIITQNSPMEPLTLSVKFILYNFNTLERIEINVHKQQQTKIPSKYDSKDTQDRLDWLNSKINF